MATLPSEALVETFKLESDDEGIAEVVIRQVSEGENIERAQMFAKTTRTIDDSLVGSIQLQTEYNQRMLRRKESYLALAEVRGITKGGKEIFRSGRTEDGAKISAAMSETEFNRAWGQLHPDMAAEIARLVLKVNRAWDPDAQTQGE